MHSDVLDDDFPKEKLVCFSTPMVKLAASCGSRVSEQREEKSTHDSGSQSAKSPQDSLVDLWHDSHGGYESVQPSYCEASPLLIRGARSMTNVLQRTFTLAGRDDYLLWPDFDEVDVKESLEGGVADDTSTNVTETQSELPSIADDGCVSVCRASRPDDPSGRISYFSENHRVASESDADDNLWESGDISGEYFSSSDPSTSSHALLTRSPQRPYVSVDGLRKESKTSVLLHVYDVTGRVGVQWVNALLAHKLAPVKIGGFFHTGVEVNGLEWTFGRTREGTGVRRSRPIAESGEHYRETIFLGHTKLPYSHIEAVFFDLRAEYLGEGYDLLHRNCNTFACDLVHRLGVGPVPGWTFRLGSLGAGLSKPAWGIDLRQATAVSKLCTVEGM